MKENNNILIQSLLDNMLEGCQSIGFDWRYLYINHSAEIQNRRSSDELIGKTYQEMWPGIENTRVYALIKDTLENRALNKMENEFEFPDGKKGWFELRISPIPEGVFIMSLDISDKKTMEADLRKTEEQFLQAQKLESIGQLAGGIAHDFNNILGVILGHVEMAFESVSSSDPLYDDLTQIHKAAERSTELIQQLLGFARRQSATPKIINPNEVIQSSLNFLKRVVGEDVSIVWHPDKNIHSVKIDPNQLIQVLTNLCINARDAITSVGEISIETRNVTIDKEYCTKHYDFFPGDFVLLSVSDTGCGMDSETSSRVFEPFFTTKDLGHGTGLGLATAYGIVKQNEGFINVYSELGKGSTFRIYLAADKSIIKPERKTKIKKVSSIGNVTILLVEDNQSILNVTKRMLEQLGYHILAANSPTRAFQIAQKFPGKIQLLITDVIMPEMTGPELENIVREVYPKIITLFTSGYTANIITRQGFIKEGVNFLPKPYSGQQIGEKIHDLLEQSLGEEVTIQPPSE